jgi:hypothetical protein
MGFRQTTAFKVLPGVRMCLPDPGTGERHALTVRSLAGGVPLADDGAVRAPRAPFRPWERRLHQALAHGDVLRVRRLAGRRGHRLLGSALGGLTAYADGAGEVARPLLHEAWRARYLVEEHPLVAARLPHATVGVDVSADVHAVVPISRDAVGLALVDTLRRADATGEAIEVAEQLDPSVVAALALTDLYERAGRTDDVVALTEGVSNTDDASALLLVRRAVALRDTGRAGEADAALADAIRWGVRGSVVRRLAMRERDHGPT